MGKNNLKIIKYPYLPDGRTIKYVSKDNEFMKKAFKNALEKYQNATNQEGKKMTMTSAVIVKNGQIIGEGINGDGYHQERGCVRVEKKMPSGVGYDLCDGCKDKNHAERVAIRKAIENNAEADLQGADLYLYGHWWCCEPCWDKMIEAGIKNVYLLENSEVLFDRDNPKNIITTQFKS